MTRLRQASAAAGSHVAFAAAAYLLLAIAQTWPLSLHLSDRIPHDLGDPLLVTYLVNWNTRVVPLTEKWWGPPFFWPEPNAITLSEPFLGVAPPAWALATTGASAAAIYNVLFLAAFWLSPLALYLLVHFLTRDAAASFIAGVAFGFAPYRASHLPHLQLLLVPALPLVFLALHRVAATPRYRWAIAAGLLWIWQALSGMYFLFLIPIAVALWLAWFAGTDWGLWARVVAASAIAAALAAPIFIRYQESHRAADYQRPYDEVRAFSADATALTQASGDLRFRVVNQAPDRAEQELFPGFATALLAALAFGGTVARGVSIRRTTIALLAIAALTGVTALIAALHPISTSIAGVPISLRSPDKSLAVLWIAAFAAFLSSRTAAAGWKNRSVALGYGLMALALWVLALGPEPAFAGSPIWYRSPYWALYQYLPGFDELRVPARFWVMVTMCLAVLAGLGAHRVMQGPRRMAVGATAVIALLVEGWIAPLRMEPLPQPVKLPAAAEVVLELPAGRAVEDASAMYRSLFHGLPVLNGYSGYRPAAYGRLLNDIRNIDVDALAAAAHGAQLAVIFNASIDRSAPIYQAVAARAASCTGESAVRICLMPTSSQPAPRR
jgi:hypothetical protein